MKKIATILTVLLLIALGTWYVSREEGESAGNKVRFELVGLSDSASLADYARLPVREVRDSYLRVDVPKSITVTYDGCVWEGTYKWTENDGWYSSLPQDVYTAVSEEGKTAEIRLRNGVLASFVRAAGYSSPEKRLSQDECRALAEAKLSDLRKNAEQFVLDDERQGGGEYIYVFSETVGGYPSVSTVKIRVAYDGRIVGYEQTAEEAFTGVRNLPGSAETLSEQLKKLMEELYPAACRFQRSTELLSVKAARTEDGSLALLVRTRTVFLDEQGKEVTAGAVWPEQQSEAPYEDLVVFLYYLD